MSKNNKNKVRRYRIKDAELAKSLGCQVNTSQRYRLNSHQEKQLLKFYTEQQDSNQEDKVPEQLRIAKSKTYDETKKRFIVTWAQSETEVHKQFFDNIKAYAEHIDAGIHVIAGRYKNPVSLQASKRVEQAEKNKEVKWDDSVLPYLDANRQKVHKYLTILGDVKVMPTAVTPLTGFNGITSLESCIIGHPSLHLQSLPVLPNYPNKLLLTTGACTLPNYSDTKAGKKGAFHHSLGFVVVELDGEHFHVRQVQCNENDGSFYDLNYFVNQSYVFTNRTEYPAIVMGDLHLGYENKKVVKETFKLIDKIGFDNIILHDVFDGLSINPHQSNDPFLLNEMDEADKGDLNKEVRYMKDWFKDRHKYNFVSVMANHNNFLDRWLRDADWKKVKNKRTYLELALLKLTVPRKSIVNLMLKDLPNVKTLEYGESFRVLGYELALHGDIGNAGSRATPTQFKNLNTKVITAHTHSPSRQLGSLVAGTSTELDMGYNSNSLCSWMQSHVIIYPNGKASHINFVNGKFTTLLKF